MKSLRSSGHADLVIDTYGNNPEITLFSLLRYSEFKDFKIVSKGLSDKKENLEITWTPHPNEVRKNRVMTFTSPDIGKTPLSKKIPDNEKPPFKLQLDAPEKPGLWTVRIKVSQSRIGGRFAKEMPNAECEYLRMPEKWIDWPEIPDLTHDKIPADFSVFRRFLGKEKAWSQMPWSSFLKFFHCCTSGIKDHHIGELPKVLGMELLKQIFPFSKGKFWRIRNKSGTLLRLHIISDTNIESTACNCFESTPPSEWHRFSEGIEFDFNATSENSKTLWRFVWPKGNTVPIVEGENKKFLFSKWLSYITGSYESGIISPEIPVQSVWKNPLHPVIVDKTLCEDSFSYKNLIIDEQFDNAKPLKKLCKQRSTLMAEAFAKCIKDQKVQFEQRHERFAPITPSLKKEISSLADLWDKWLKTESNHSLVSMMISERLRQNPLDAFSGAVALMSRFKANGYIKLINKFSEKGNFESILSDTQSFVITYMPRSFLRDLILSEIIISWYWDKRYYEFDAKSKTPKEKSLTASNKSSLNPGVSRMKNADDAQCRAELNSRPCKLSRQDVSRIWKQKKFYKPGNKAESFYLNRFKDNEDGTIFDSVGDLIWQKSGSLKSLSWSEAQKYIVQLKQQKFAGYSDWRMPTLEELGSLLEPSETFNQTIRTAYYVSWLFSKDQILCWSSDQHMNDSHWYISFFSGEVMMGSSIKNWVRAVRSVTHKDEG